MKNIKKWLIALGAFLVVGVIGLAVYSNQSGGLFKGAATQEVTQEIPFSESQNTKVSFSSYVFDEIKSEQNSELGNSKLSVWKDDVDNGRIKINTGKDTAFTIINKKDTNDLLFKFELDKSSLSINQTIPIVTLPSNDIVKTPVLSIKEDDTLTGTLEKVNPTNFGIAGSSTSNDLAPNFSGLEGMTAPQTGSGSTKTQNGKALTPGTVPLGGTMLQNGLSNQLQNLGTFKSSFNFMNLEKAFAAEDSNNPLDSLKSMRLIEIDPTKTINYFHLKDLNINLNDTNKIYDLGIGYVVDSTPTILMNLRFDVQDEEKKVEPIIETKCTDEIYPTLNNYSFTEKQSPPDAKIMQYDSSSQSDSITNILNVVSKEKGVALCEDTITQFKFNIKLFDEYNKTKGKETLYTFNLDPSKYNQNSFISRKSIASDNTKSGRSYALVNNFKTYYDSSTHKLKLAEDVLLNPNTLYVMEIIGLKGNDERLNLAYLFKIKDDKAQSIPDSNDEDPNSEQADQFNQEDNNIEDKAGCIAFDSAKFSPTSQKDATDKITFTYQFYDKNNNPVGLSIDGACYSSLIKWFGDNKNDSNLKTLIESSLSPKIIDTKIVIPYDELNEKTYYNDFLGITMKKEFIQFALDPAHLPQGIEKGKTYSLSFGKAEASFSFKTSQIQSDDDLGNNDTGNKGGSGTNNNDTGNKGTGTTTTPTPTTTTTTTSTPTPVVTKVSITPCKVGDQEFYLAEGPDSSYCKDLQALGEKIARVDQAPETPQVRYTTALFAQRVVADTITKLKLNTRIKVRNLPNDWYKSLTDAKEIEASSDEEIANFKAVYASGILRGRKDPKTGAVTLAPLGRIKYIEILALLDQSITSVIGYTPSVSDSSMPPFALAYRNNPDTAWMYRSIAFGIEFNIITKNEFNSNTIQEFATREDMARFLARFQNAIEKNPKLLGGK